MFIWVCCNLSTKKTSYCNTARIIALINLCRSMPFCEEHFSGSRREQFNDITAFVDASNVYGSDQK